MWTPNEQGLAQIVQLFNDSRTPNTQVQRQCTEQLEHFNKTVPDFNNYLAYIFVELKNQELAIRQGAGLVLKTNLRKYYNTILPQALDHIKLLLIEGLRDPVYEIRSTAGNVITSLIYHNKISNWPQILPALVQLLDSGEPDSLEGAFSALLKICEDNSAQLDDEDMGRPLNIMIPKFIQFFGHPNENIRKTALACVVQFLTLMPGALCNNMDSFMKGITVLASDPSPRVRKYVCSAFVSLLVHPVYLKPIFNQVIDYMIHCTSQHRDESLSLGACEFWTAICENDECQELIMPLQQHLPKIIRVLIGSMEYSESDREMQEQDSQAADKDTDVKPFHVQQKSLNFHDSKTTPSQMLDANPQPSFHDDDDDDDDDDDYDDDFDYEGHASWNLRKCAASSLDLMSNIFGNDILASLLPEIQERMRPQVNWWQRECAILAIGAIAEGCRTGMYTHLPTLVPYLISVLQDPKPLVRSITCWSLGRYSRWIVEQPEELYFKPMLAALLVGITDPNKRVQEAACSAFATLEEAAHYLLVPYIPHILSAVEKAFEMYSKKNLPILYDAIRTLADVVGDTLNNKNYIALLMPPLINKWNQISDSDRNIFPLLDCLTGIAAALKTGFLHFAHPVYQRCLRLISNTYLQQADSKVEIDRDFVVCSLDLLSGMIEALQGNIESLIYGSDLLPLLSKCMMDRVYEVRRSAFGVVGDLAKICIAQLRPAIGDFMPLLIRSLDSKNVGVSSNACWAIGEIAMGIGADIKPYVYDSLGYLVAVMNETQHNVDHLENTAITIGRLGLVCPDMVSPHLPKFSKNWCLALRGIRNNTEKEHSFKGMCVMIRANPNGVMNAFPFVCECIASYDDAPQDLKQEFAQILNVFKDGMKDGWGPYFSRFPENIQLALRRNYNL
ncbi:transportin protein TNPO1 [Acrasis kona]|uniref:Transportin protein TNPO1 n=1 Tax=Acrasis kona TaxID=1008807 RepID=A0AAW2Z1G9_9EUKA